MSENLKSDRESNNTTKHIESTKLDSANKGEVRLDSHGDEIVYEVKHKLSLWDCFMFNVMLFFGVIMIYGGIRDFLLANKMDGVMFVMLSILGILFTLVGFYRLFYMRKNRFYVANNGIGFEYRHWFRMHKRFFKFGEVGLVLSYFPAPAYFDTSKEIFIIHPINITYKHMALVRFRDKNYKRYIFCKVMTELYRDDIKEIITFMRQKTKEALESQGIEISDSELKDKFKHLWYKDI